jgi:hypothetical protein
MYKMTVFGKIYQASKKHAVAIAAAGVVGLSAVPSHAAAIMDFTGVGTKITEELTPAITAAMPFLGLILAVGIAVKIYKRFAKG